MPGSHVKNEIRPKTNASVLNIELLCRVSPNKSDPPPDEVGATIFPTITHAMANTNNRVGAIKHIFAHNNFLLLALLGCCGFWYIGC